MERSRLGVSFVAGIILAVVGSLPAGADPVRVPGTSTSLQPPPGFSLADSFPGFRSAELQATIMVTELPVPAPALMEGMTREALASRGMTLLSSQSETIGGRQALLLHVAQAAAGTEYLKWMLVTGDDKAAVMVVGTFPKSAAGGVGASIRSAVLSTSWGTAGAGDPFEGLRFRVTPTDRLKLAGRVSNMLMLTESGSTGPLGPGEPLYVVGSSIGPAGSGDLKAFSEARARQTEQIEDLRNVMGREITLGGLAAYEILADARDVKTGTPLRLYQVIALDGDGYFIVQGLVGADRAAEMLPELRRVTESFRRD